MNTNIQIVQFSFMNAELVDFVPIFTVHIAVIYEKI